MQTIKKPNAEPAGGSTSLSFDHSGSTKGLTATSEQSGRTPQQSGQIIMHNGQLYRLTPVIQIPSQQLQQTPGKEGHISKDLPQISRQISDESVARSQQVLSNALTPQHVISVSPPHERAQKSRMSVLSLLKHVAEKRKNQNALKRISKTTEMFDFIQDCARIGSLRSLGLSDIPVNMSHSIQTGEDQAMPYNYFYEPAKVSFVKEDNDSEMHTNRNKRKNTRGSNSKTKRTRKAKKFSSLNYYYNSTILSAPTVNKSQVTAARPGEGRPKPVARRGPGRPPKAAKLSNILNRPPSSESNPVAGRGPGRPPKTAKLSNTFNRLQTNESTLPRKRPGRPPKYPVQTQYTISGGQKRRVCAVTSCTTLARGSTLLCITHGGGRRCIVDNCNSGADRAGKCKKHGGGNRCISKGCLKSARSGTSYCITHGGGKRCIIVGCVKGAVGPTNKCVAHGGGRKCTYSGCEKSVQDGTSSCRNHADSPQYVISGGKKRRVCAVDSCITLARGSTLFCIAHGGGGTCMFPGCNKPRHGGEKHCPYHCKGTRLENGKQVENRCEVLGCTLFTADGFSGSRRCIKHIQGKRCEVPNCFKACLGENKLCITHRKPCKYEGCNKKPAQYTNFCKAHGKKAKCVVQSCLKLAQAGTRFCTEHDVRCAVQSCAKLAQGSTKFCFYHGGGRRCKAYSCNNIVTRSSVRPSALGKGDFCRLHIFKNGMQCSVGTCRKYVGVGTEFCELHSYEKANNCGIFKKKNRVRDESNSSNNKNLAISNQKSEASQVNHSISNEHTKNIAANFEKTSGNVETRKGVKEDRVATASIKINKSNDKEKDKTVVKAKAGLVAIESKGNVKAIADFTKTSGNVETSKDLKEGPLAPASMNSNKSNDKEKDKIIVQTKAELAATESKSIVKEITDFAKNSGKDVKEGPLATASMNSNKSNDKEMDKIIVNTKAQIDATESKSIAKEITDLVINSGKGVREGPMNSNKSNDNEKDKPIAGSVTALAATLSNSIDKEIADFVKTAGNVETSKDKKVNPVGSSCMNGDKCNDKKKEKTGVESKAELAAIERKRRGIYSCHERKRGNDKFTCNSLTEDSSLDEGVENTKNGQRNESMGIETNTGTRSGKVIVIKEKDFDKPGLQGAQLVKATRFTDYLTQLFINRNHEEKNKNQRNTS